MLKAWSRKNRKYIILVAIFLIVILILIDKFELSPVIIALTIALFNGFESESNSFESHYEKYPNKQFDSHSYSFGKNISIVSHYFMIADGKIGVKEKEFYTKFLKDEFESEARTKKLLRFLESFDKNKFTLQKASRKLLTIIGSRERVRFLHYLISLITQDKFLSVDEIALLKKFCKYINVNYRTLEAALALYNYTSEEDLNRKTYVKTYTSNSIIRCYKILEIDETATEEKIKTAYRKLVKIYHPDKQIGKKNPNSVYYKQKFQAIQEAYDNIKTHKGIK